MTERGSSTTMEGTFPRGAAILGRCIAICHAKNDLSEDRCRKCGVPLLK